ncbi:MAG: lipid A deacylase LpxR family protein [Congregibacter sp.]
MADSEAEDTLAPLVRQRRASYAVGVTATTSNPKITYPASRHTAANVFLWLCIAAALAVWSPESLGEDTSIDGSEARNWTLNLYIENDLFAQTDRDYTNGIRISVVSPDLVDYIEDETLPAWVRGINRKLTFFRDDPKEALQRNLVLSLGQTIFTPRDREATALVKDDRPYAGWLFARAGYQTRSELQMDSLEISIGVVGPAALGQESQDLVHDLRGFERFEGWDNQLDNELGFNILWEEKRKARFFENSNSRFAMDMIGHAGIALGNVATYTNIGAELRLGWSIPDDFGTASLRPGGDNSTPDVNWSRRNTDRDWGLHGFVSFDTRLVARNIFLDGNSFENSHSVDREPVVADAAVGLSMYYRGARLSYAQIFRSREFDTQGETHSYGSLALSYILKF